MAKAMSGPTDPTPVAFFNEAASEATRWHMQTKTGGGAVPPEERGDCVPACITSILGLPLTAITHGEDWWERLNAECAKHGYCMGQLDMQLAPPDGYWLAQVPSLNLPTEPDGQIAYHCVVARGDELIHDPSLGKRYDDALWTEAWSDGRIAEGWVLIPLDPAALEALPERSKALLALAALSERELVERVAMAIRYGQPHDGSDCDDGTVLDAARILTALGLPVAEQEATG